jgi:GT2 family glycosyltransferase
MYDISILIVNWNTRRLLRECLFSICRSGCSRSFETIVVDNNSTDGSAEMVQQDFPTVRLIRNSTNLGFAKACNQAIGLATGQYLLLLNSDAEVRIGSLDAMSLFMARNRSVAAVGCKLLNPDGSVQQSCWHCFPSIKDAAIRNLYLYRLFPWKKLSREHHPLSSGEEEAMDVAHLLGACVMLRRDALVDVGLFDEGYFMYLEETDWFYRARARGWRVCYLPSAEALHHGQQSSNLDPAHVVPHLLTSYCRFVRKHYGTRSVPIIKAIFAVGALIRICLWTKRWLSGSDRPLARKMISAYSVILGALGST